MSAPSKGPHLQHDAPAAASSRKTAARLVDRNALSSGPASPRAWGARILSRIFGPLDDSSLEQKRKSPDQCESSARSPTPSSPSSSGASLVNATGGTNQTHRIKLPPSPTSWDDEFPPTTDADQRRQRLEIQARILRLAASRVLEPPTLYLLAGSAATVLGLAAIEGSILCASAPFLESWDAGSFVIRYALAQLLPSCVWSTMDAPLVATACGLDPDIILRSLDPVVPHDAAVMIQAKALAAGRSIMAGFMLLAQLVRAAGISAESGKVYEKRVAMGREPPLLCKGGGGITQNNERDGGIVIRLCGKESDVTALSLQRMGRHIFPVFEDAALVAHLVSQHSRGGRTPVFWCVRAGRYGSRYPWDGFPVGPDCLLHGTNGRRILLLEADATNCRDPLSLGDQSLDLTIDDASQAFHRISCRFFDAKNVPQFQTYRVFLGNTLETARTGGGYSYTLRHRIQYAKEVDVVIDSRAPVLQEILTWCSRVAKDRRVLFQTRDRQYFLSLKLLMKRYNYEIYDPLDLRALVKDMDIQQADGLEESNASRNEGKIVSRKTRSMLKVLLDDQDAWEDHLFIEDMWNSMKGKDTGEKVDARPLRQVKKENLRRLTKLSKLPRLVYYGTTAETVNAVEAMVNAGELDATNCCALLDKQEGVAFLDLVLSSKSSLVQAGGMGWKGDGRTSPALKEDQGVAPSRTMNGLHIICPSTIYDDLFREVRGWARAGYTPKEIQKDLDQRFQHILHHSQEVEEVVAEVEAEEGAVDADAKAPSAVVASTAAE